MPIGATRSSMVLAAAVITTASWSVARGETDRQPAAGEILKRLQKLSVVGSVLYIAAHPDDENTSLLTYLASGRGLRAVYLSATRGDGGQNLIGSEQGVNLGIIRTQELLAARRIDGAEQMFSRARDFGFSKSVDEALRWWGEEEILADFVLAIRRVRPDLVITRFSSSGGGHGHHTASARLAERAFKAAADSKYQPAGIPRLPPWQARRLLHNRGGGGSPGEGGMRLDVGTFDPLLGGSYGEISAQSRSMHKSQGFGQARRRGPQIEGFGLTAEAPGETTGKSAKSPLDGIDWSWKRIPGSDRVAKLAAEAARAFRPENPAASIPTLVALDAALEGLGDAYWRDKKRAEVAQLVAACTGLFIEANAARPTVVPGETLPVTVTVLNRSPLAIKLGELRFAGAALGGEVGKPAAAGKPLPQHEPQRLELSVSAGAAARPSTPYWLVQDPEPGRFKVADPTLIGTPENAPVLSVLAEVEVGGRRFMLSSPVFHKWTDPVAGERSRPLEVLPAVSVAPVGNVLLFPDARPQTMRVRLKAFAAGTGGTLRLELPEGFAADPASVPFKLVAAGDESELRFAVRPPRAGKGAAVKTAAAVASTLKVVADVGGRPLSSRVDFITHDHIPIQMVLTDARVRLAPVDLRREGKRIGYIAGAGDEVAQSLERVGYEVVFLDEVALTSAPLGGFDAIVMGVRAFNTNERLQFHHGRLMDYVKAGGTLVVQYNTSNRLSSVAGSIGPLPFDIGRDRVTDETAAVHFQEPQHPLLTFPNRLGPADFEGWVQERGLYFASSWDKGYQAPLSIADPGESASRGSLIVTRHGKGAFIYTGLAFFRQLPAGVPGAYRLFANLVAHGRAPRR
jgi:LmbE family N-acetylglucosaminyl deacetylase